MVAVQAVVHIDAVAVEVEMRDTGLAVRMERDDILGVGKAAGRPAALLFSGKPDPVESLDEIFGQLLPVFQGPAFGVLILSKECQLDSNRRKPLADTSSSASIWDPLR